MQLSPYFPRNPCTIITYLVVREPHGELDGDYLDDVLDGVEPRQHGGRVRHHHHPVHVLVEA